MAIANQLRSLSLLTLLSSSLLLAACGGSGSSGGSSSQASSAPKSSSSTISSEASSSSLSSETSSESLSSTSSGASPSSNSSVSSQSSIASQNSVSSSSSSSGVVVVPTYSLGGNLQGVVGTGLQLANGSDQLVLTTDGNFVFGGELHQGDSYTITIAQQPTAPTQTCVLANASGTVGAADITNVQVSCTTNTYSIGGSVSGLNGSGLVLQNNAGDDLAVAADGNFTFATALDDGSNFAVTIATQPTAPSQTCSLSSASGTLNGANNSAVSISCTTNTYTIGGSVTGLTATGLVLQNNGGDDLTVDADGNFVFATALDDQSAFSVSVKTQPEKHLCSVTDASGTLAGANVSTVAISCLNAPAAPELALAYGPKLFKFTWDAVDGATYYKLLENADGSSGYTQVGDDLTSTSYDEEVTLFNRIGAQYTLEACNQAGCNTSAVVNVSEHLEEAIGYVQAELAEDGDAGEQLSVAISADGNTLVFGAYGNDSNSASDETDNSADNSGAVYVFQKQDGVWQQQAFLKASTIDVGDCFGFRVALSADGSVLAVAAPFEKSNAQGINGNESDNSVDDSGAVYVFKRTGSNWAQQAYIKASNNMSLDWQQFGWALALSADGLTLAVGSPGESSNATGVGVGSTNTSAPHSGAVYVYGFDGSDWSQNAYIKASNTDADDYFGAALSLSADGNCLVISSPGESSDAVGVNDILRQSDNSKNSTGAVYVFNRVLGNWSQQDYLKASSPDIGDRFGDSLALSSDGKTLAIGSENESSAATGVNGDETDNSAGRSGAVYVFSLGGAGWSQQAYIKASNTESGDRFGSALALTSDGSLLAVGSPSEASRATGLNGDQYDDVDRDGAVYLFKLKQTGWDQSTYVKAPILKAPSFGAGLVFTPSGDTLAVSAQIPYKNVDNNYANLPGGIYLY